MPASVKVELLYIDGCPHAGALAQRLRQALEDAGASAEVELRRVRSAAEADSLRFLGSPTVRIDGRDIEPASVERRDWGLKCRLYRGPDGLGGLPDEELLRSAVKRGQSTDPA